MDIKPEIIQEKNYSGIERAAIMMFSLPEEQTKNIFLSLEDDEIRDISRVMTSLGSVNASVVERLCMDFVNEIASSGSLIGSVETTRRLLLKFMKKEEVDIILSNIQGPAGRSLWDKLNNVDEELLSGYLKNESPQTIAVIMSRVSAEKASKVLTLLPQSLADDVILRIIRMDTVRNEVIDDIEVTLNREFISTLGRSTKKDPYEVMAEMFNTLDRNAEARLMKGLEKNNPEAAQIVRKLMFTFEDLIEMDSFSLQRLVGVIDRSRLALALKGTQDSVKNAFIECLSKRGAKLLIDEMSALGLVKLKDVENAQNSIVAIAKDMATRNEIVISKNAESSERLVV